MKKYMDKFLVHLYDVLIKNEIVNDSNEQTDLKTKMTKINNYLEKIEKTHTQAKSKKKNVARLKELYYNKYIIKEKDIPNSYFEFLERQYLNEGYGHVNLVKPQNSRDEMLRKEHINSLIREQKASLDSWIDYFLSEDSSYLPMWAKVWAFQGMLHIGNLNKETNTYGKRTKNTVNAFVPIDAEILGKCVEQLIKISNGQELTKEEKEKLLAPESQSFSKLYGNLLTKKRTLTISTNEGIWIKYQRETNEKIAEKEEKGIEPEYIKLYNSLQNYNTGWCTAGSKETAKSQILGGDFYVYYSQNESGEHKIPRIAIRMQQNTIAEIRGIAKNQNIETDMEKVLDKKLKEFPDAKAYQKKVNNMKKLTEIYNKHKNQETLTKEELIYIYEIYDIIEGFGYQKDPRIDEIKEARNRTEDIINIFECKEDEIGFKIEDLDRKLIYYEGDLDLEELVDVDFDEELILPKFINGNLNLTNLKSCEGIQFPDNVNGNVDLSSLKNIDEELVLPEIINGNLDLSNLTSAEGLTLPKVINGDLDLSSLTSAEDLTFPKVINGDLDLSGLTSTKGLVLPKVINGTLDLSRLAIAKEINLPSSVKDSELDLYKNYFIESMKGLVLPESVRKIDLSDLKSLYGLTFPQTVETIIYQNNYYTLDEIKELQRQESLEPFDMKKYVKRKTKGYISYSLLIANIILLGILLYIITLIIIK